MPGLIESTLNPNNTAQSAALDTEDTDQALSADDGKDTVAGQLHSLLSSGSPYLERAKAGAMQTANRRGLLNSSMAATAGEAAAIDAALPIATADAGARQNLRQIEKQGEVETGLIGKRSDEAQKLQTLQGAQAIEQQTLKGTQETGLQTLKGQQAEKLAQIDGSYRTLLQSSASATSMYNGITKNINDIMANSDITPANKQKAIDRNIDLLEAGLAILGGIGDLDLTSLLNFSGAGIPAPSA